MILTSYRLLFMQMEEKYSKANLALDQLKNDKDEMSQQINKLKEGKSICQFGKI